MTCSEYLCPYTPLLTLHVRNGRGRSGDEIQDYSYNMNNPRRRSNSSSHGHAIKDFKTKFETVEPEPVFEEELHGPPAEEEELKLVKEDSEDSTSAGSVEEEEHAPKI